MPRRATIFLLLALLSALVCVRLGFWQLSRLNARRARNAIVASRLDSLPVTLAELPRDTALARFRAVRLTGTYDYANEHYIVGRSHQGSPGVHIITPLRLWTAAGDSAVPVNRGWVYAPDASVVPEAERWREGDTVRTVTGFVESYPPPLAGAAALASVPRALRWLDPRAFAARASYAVTPYYVVSRDSVPAARRDSTPVRLSAPRLGEGSHQSYAIQWFSFALIALVGGVFYSRAEWKRQ
jgi:surfeit locus 1 family protein